MEVARVAVATHTTGTIQSFESFYRHAPGSILLLVPWAPGSAQRAAMPLAPNVSKQVCCTGVGRQANKQGCMRTNRNAAAMWAGAHTGFNGGRVVGGPHALTGYRPGLLVLKGCQKVVVAPARAFEPGSIARAAAQRRGRQRRRVERAARPQPVRAREQGQYHSWHAAAGGRGATRTQ